jgi:hypothetical protein
MGFDVDLVLFRDVQCGQSGQSTLSERRSCVAPARDQISNPDKLRHSPRVCLSDLASKQSDKVPWFSSNSTTPWLSAHEVGALVPSRIRVVNKPQSTDSEYRDRLQLKSETDRILGVGTSDTEIAALVVSSGTMMRVRLDMDHIRDFSPKYVLCLEAFSH